MSDSQEILSLKILLAKFCIHFPYSMTAACPTDLILIDFITRIIFGEENKL
jgi:hypothetical protein